MSCATSTCAASTADVILPMTVLRPPRRGAGGQQAGGPRHEGDPRRRQRGRAGRRPCARRRGRRSTILPASPSATCAHAPIASSLPPTSRRTSTGSRPTCRTSSTTSSSATRSRGCRAPDALGTLIEKLTSPDINLSPVPVRHADGSVKHPGLDNHGMGTIFEELIRRFNRGEQRGGGRALDPARRGDADGEADLPADRRRDQLRHLPAVRRRLRHWRHADRGRGDAAGACRRARQGGGPHLYGQELNAETYAICKADLLLKGEGAAADNIVGRPGALHSVQRRLPGTRVRLHALQSALRHELEDRSGADGRQAGHARTRGS